MHSAYSHECADWIAIPRFDYIHRRFANMAESKKARAKKELSKERQAAMTKLKNASSDQEKTVARQQLHLVRFKEVASIRADASIRALKNLEKVCDTTSYAWTQDQAEKLINAIGPIWSRIVDGLKKPGAKTAKREKFTL